MNAEAESRYYDPNAGRFLSEDPIRYSGGIDFYAYIGNNPTNRTDPEGMGDTPRSCAKALADLAKAQAVASARLAEYIAHGQRPAARKVVGPSAAHFKSPGKLYEGHPPREACLTERSYRCAQKGG